MTSPERKAEPSAGATGCAAGSQMCNGASPALNPNPISANTNAVLLQPMGIDCASSGDDRQIEAVGMSGEDHEGGDHHGEADLAERQEEEGPCAHALPGANGGGSRASRQESSTPRRRGTS